MSMKGKESWEFGKKLGMRARDGEERVVEALVSIVGGKGGLGEGVNGLQ